MSEELKPCPFCGKAPYTYDEGEDSPPCARCKDPQCAGGRGWVLQSRWNRRAPDAELAALRADRDRLAARVAELERDNAEFHKCVMRAEAAYCDLEAERDSLRAAAVELLEVADLRGDADLPKPDEDPNLWTARMQTAWDEMRAALAPRAAANTPEGETHG